MQAEMSARWPFIKAILEVNANKYLTPNMAVCSVSCSTIFLVILSLLTKMYCFGMGVGKP